MEARAKKNIIYKGKIHSAGESFECDEANISELAGRGLIESVSVEIEMGLPSLEEELKRKKKK